MVSKLDVHIVATLRGLICILDLWQRKPKYPGQISNFWGPKNPLFAFVCHYYPEALVIQHSY